MCFGTRFGRDRFEGRRARDWVTNASIYANETQFNCSKTASSSAGDKVHTYVTTPSLSPVTPSPAPSVQPASTAPLLSFGGSKMRTLVMGQLGRRGVACEARE